MSTIGQVWQGTNRALLFRHDALDPHQRTLGGHLPGLKHRGDNRCSGKSLTLALPRGVLQHSNHVELQIISTSGASLRSSIYLLPASTRGR